MRLALQTVICCCVFTMVLPLVKGATGDFNSSLKKRLRVWLQSRMKRDVRSGLVTDGEQDPESHVGPQQNECADPPSSFDLNNRSKRSSVTSAKSSGCALVTCAVHDLYQLLYQFQNNDKTNAPPEKIITYGRRRRRSLLDVAQRRGWSTTASQGRQGHKTPQVVA
ncbi:ADM [Myripristis murdjan]|uniref:ADM-like n=1 Tax=Myripristis murdjan TaxID=586833 RepID=A0A667ZS15_9TELE|nr:ADM-like [Myripristis murdjan]